MLLRAFDKVLDFALDFVLDFTLENSESTRVHRTEK